MRVELECWKGSNKTIGNFPSVTSCAKIDRRGTRRPVFSSPSIHSLSSHRHLLSSPHYLYLAYTTTSTHLNSLYSPPLSLHLSNRVASSVQPFKMQSRPQLSLSIGRRPSLQVPTTASAGPSSPLAQTPYTPQTTSFFPSQESYFPSFAPGPSTPPISANGLYPPPFPGRRGLLRRNSSLSSVSSSIGDEDEDLDLQWTEQEEESVRTVSTRLSNERNRVEKGKIDSKFHDKKNRCTILVSPNTLSLKLPFLQTVHLLQTLRIV